MKKIYLTLILILAALLRLWNLGSFPAFNADEAALGYNAYSLIQTGKDEHGNPWPLHFQSFNDYKPGGYVYLILPFVKFMGLNEWSVRLPNALLGIATVYIIYLLVKQLFKSSYELRVTGSNSQLTTLNSEALALTSSFLLAISPWHLHFSRGGWEVNTATFFITLGVYLFLKFISIKKFIYLAFSFLVFSFSLYTYHSSRIITPILSIALIIIYWKDLEVKKYFKLYILYSIFYILLLLPLAVDLTKDGAISRAAGVGLFADPGPISRIEEQRSQHTDFRNIESKIIHNKLINYGLAFLENWSEHYHGLFLFLSGDDIQRNKVPETGQLYLFEIITVLLGVFVLLKSSFLNPKSSYLVFLWLLVAPMASALTFQSPHALRSQNMVIPLTIISSLGLGYALSFFKKFSKIAPLRVWHLAFGIVILWQFARYQHMYWAHMAKEYPFSSQYGVKELVNFVGRDEFKERQIVITDRYDQPYILFLFFTKYDPKKFQEEHSLTQRDGYGFSTVRDFDRFHFYSVKWGEIMSDYPNSIIAGTAEEIPREANIIKDIYGNNGYKYFRIVAN